MTDITFTVEDSAGAIATGRASFTVSSGVPADGSANAPFGTPQFPTLFSAPLNGGRYAKIPTWNVAGVNYYAGVPQNITLKDPRKYFNNSSQPGWKLLQFVNGLYYVQFGGNLVVDGFDFSLQPGTIYSSGVDPGLTVQNCNMGTTSIAQRSGGTTILKNLTFDCGGAFSDKLIDFNSGSTASDITIEYCKFNQFHAHIISLGDAGAVVRNFTFNYNLIIDGGAGTGDGSHLNYLQWQGTAGAGTTVKWMYNTIVQRFQPNQGEGPQFYGGNITSCELANNTFVTVASGTNVPISQMVNIGWTAGNAGQILNINIHDNYVDGTGILAQIFTTTTTVSNPPGMKVTNFSNNFKMTNGTLITAGNNGPL